jgi:hypothetical protein
MLINYRFKFPDGREDAFAVELDATTSAYETPAAGTPPEWTALGNHQCGICPLKAESSPRCPVAVNLAPAIDRFINRISYEDVEVWVTTAAREYYKRVSLQKAVSGLFGLIMVSSGCPILDKLRPMTLTHLPFAEMEETRYRTISMYLFAQFFRARKGLTADWDLSGLEKILGDIGKVNRDFVDRLRALPMKDANLNAIVSLDCFLMPTAATMNRSIQKLERLFTQYF